MGVFERMVPYTKAKTPEDEAKLASIPPGVVGIASGYLGRYREFDRCVEYLWKPPESKVVWALGVDCCYSFNTMCRHVLANPAYQWLFILGDDHVFTQDLIVKLWERNVDIVVPLCLRRTDQTPVLNRGKEGGFKSIPNSWQEILGKSGLIEWPGTCGNAGMLIRRKVLETMEPPWFRAGQIDPQNSGSDIWFSYAAREAGFPVHLDLDNPIGHILHASIYPVRDEAGNWSCEWRSI